jgi:hypothetical protein
MGHGVAASPVLRSIFVLLLVLSVGGKIAVGNQSLRGAENTMESTGKGEIAAFLNRQGFRVESLDDHPDSPFVSAIAGDCRVLAMLAAPQGWHRSMLRQLATGQDQVLFVYGATVYQEQPVWLTWTDHYWGVINRYANRRLTTRPLVGIVASSMCNLHDIHWQELAELP